MLSAGPFVDAFRFLYPKARGQFTYWSQRAGNRPVNKGIRLDYFICSQSLCPAVDSAALAAIEEKAGGEGELDAETPRSSAVAPTPVVPETEATAGAVRIFDCYSLPVDTEGASDHCPVVLVLRL